MKIIRYIFWTAVILLPLTIASGQYRDPAKEKYSDFSRLSKSVIFDAERNSVGNISMFMTNFGRFGVNLEWPAGSNQFYTGQGSYLIIGGIKETSGDTLISSAAMPGSGFGLSSEFTPGRHIDGGSSDDTYSRVYLSTQDIDDWPIVDENGENVIFSDEDLYAEFNDLDTNRHTNNSRGSLDIVITQRSMVWNLLNFSDAIIIEYNIINVGDERLKDVFLGYYSDPDISFGFDDLIEWDSDNEIIFTSDSDGRSDFSQGEPWQTGYLANAFIETPTQVIDDPENSSVNSVYLGNFFEMHPSFSGNGWFKSSDDIEYLKFSQNILAAFSPGASDKAIIVSSSLFDIAPGDSERVIIAFALADEKETAVQIINDLRISVLGGWIFPAPPSSPELTAFPGDGEVTLSWSSDPISEIDLFSQVASDPRYRALDFQGFRIYRKNERGDSGWEFLEQYDLIDNKTAARFGANQARETGIKLTYLDTSVINGFSYEYSVTSFDLNLDTLSFESSIEENRTLVTPRSNPANLRLPVTSIKHIAGSTNIFDKVELRVVDPTKVRDAIYNMVFKTVTNFNINLPTNLFPIYRYDIIETTSGDTVVHDGEIFMNTKGVSVSGTSEVFDGMILDYQVSLHDSTWWVDGIASSVEVGTVYDGKFVIGGQNHDGRFHIKDNASAFSRGVWAFTGNDFKIEWIAAAGDSLTLKVIDIQNNAEIPFSKADGYTWGIYIRNRKYENVSFSNANPAKNPFAIYVCGVTFFFNLSFDMTVPPSVGDEWTILTSGDKGPNLGNVFQFTTSKLEFVTTSIKSVSVVPNPYFVRNSWEAGYDARRIQFINLPSVATVRIFTVSGDLVKTIEHNQPDLLSGSGGTAEWNLISNHGIKVSSGMYYFQIESELGTQIGKFALIL